MQVLKQLHALLKIYMHHKIIQVPMTLRASAKNRSGNTIYLSLLLPVQLSQPPTCLLQLSQAQPMGSQLGAFLQD